MLAYFIKNCVLADQFESYFHDNRTIMWKAFVSTCNTVCVDEDV